MRKPWDPISEMQAANRALKREMMRDLEDMSRRELMRRGIKLAAGASAASLLFQAGIPLHTYAQTPAVEIPPLPEFTEIPENLKGSGEVRVQSWGGAFQDAQREAYFIPFQELSGIKVIESEGPDPSKIKAMVDTGNVEQDVVQMDRSDIMLLEKQGDYWEEIDYSLFDVDNIDESHRYKYSVDMLPYATVIGYRTDAFPEGPNTQADFWNQEAFPGPRTTTAGTGGVTPFLEAGFIANGTALDAIYPMDIEQGYEYFNAIKPYVAKFWEAGAQPAQMLTDNEVVMAHSWNGRMHAIQQEGAPVKVVWNEAQLATDVWAVPKGAANAENAMKFSAFITLPVSQARLSYLIPYGSVNKASAALMTPEQLENLPTSPAYLDLMSIRDIAWWVDNRDAVTSRWNEWILE
ncbi:MAG: ABC transporter substrate-binding protein [Thermomicrobiales bacterium]|nr:ABC transporter substrate-binding protein [Thermomicrobiales bacterium]